MQTHSFYLGVNRFKHMMKEWNIWPCVWKIDNIFTETGCELNGISWSVDFFVLIDHRLDFQIFKSIHISEIWNLETHRRTILWNIHFNKKRDRLVNLNRATLNKEDMISCHVDNNKWINMFNSRSIVRNCYYKYNI